ncbi:FT-interacting protein 7-like [Phragmites australis]|uniref:FT-interacting protein 7-like n=1 Tax=Phragmites australis TaxID=29695 RepID=UPI002D765A66|nr:FT-interacting protein 7-like [Phragmites australis]
MMKLAVEISDAADLSPKDGAGSCNPFVEVEFDDQRQRTATKPADRSPYWNHTLVFDVRDPARLGTLPVDVSVYHDRRLHDHNAIRPHTFLGRVRINAASVAPSSAEAVLQRYPLEKRGLFSRVSGDIALRLYLIQDDHPRPPAAVSSSPASLDNNNVPPPNHQQHEPVAAAAATGDPERIVRSAFAAAVGQTEQAEAESKGKSSHEPPRVFRSVPASGGGGDQQQQPRRATLHAVAAPPPPPGQTVVMPRPAGPAAPAPPGAAYGLVETKPPLPAKMGPRAAAAAAAKIASTYDMVEPMSYLYVSVVKARDLPTMDVTGALDPYVEVKLGNFKGVTKHLEKNPNPVWRQTFAFSREHLQSNQLEIVVKDKDVVKDDFVGRVVFEMSDIPHRVPPDSPLAPQWYRLADRGGDKLRHGEIMLAVWIGTQADEAFPEAWHSDAHSLPFEGLNNTRSKVYYSPKLAYLKVVAIAAQDLVPAEKGRPLAPTIAKIQLGGQVRRTRPGQPQGSANPTWNEEFMFVAGEPFDEQLVVTVEERVAPGRDEPVGRVIIPVAAPYVPRNDLAKSVETKWFNLSRGLTVDEAAASVNKDKTFASKIHLRLSLETAYHVLDESTHYSSDLQPSAKKLRKGSVGILELGILSARNLVPMKAKQGRLTDPYCVAKYGAKWVRTRTLLNTLAPQWNEQYTWEVFDPCTVITIAVFDNGHVLGDHGDAKDQRIGKVRIRLSTLEIDRVYTHFYPLMALNPSGLKKTGELHLAVRFTCTAWANMLGMYGKPLLPKMHYTNPISVLQLDYLRFQAMQMVAARLGRAEPPLRREVVEYMLDVDSHMFSLRRSKANFYRITSLFSGVVAVGKWMDGICKWKNPLTTILVHVLFLILVCYPELILPTVFLYLFMIGVWNYRRRPRKPPHMDTVLSHAEQAYPDELDEEFDTFPTTKPGDIVRMRYDRLRSVAGRVQTVVGDLATQGERAQSLLSWRDPRATGIFIMLSLIVAVVLYVTPFQVVAVVVGLYLLRHPRFRSKQPSVPFNFYKRLPAKSDVLL